MVAGGGGEGRKIAILGNRYFCGYSWIIFMGYFLKSMLLMLVFCDEVYTLNKKMGKVHKVIYFRLC